MRKEIDLTAEFHRAFRIPLRDQPQGELPESEFRLRFDLMEEENREYLEACREGDLTGIADAIGDMLYVLCGTIVTHGLQDHMEAVFEEIHRSNMSKLGPDGEPVLREDGKVTKSDRFFRPDLQSILNPKQK